MSWNLISRNGQIDLFTCEIRKEVKSTFNQRLIMDFLADEIIIDDYDAIAIPGGFEEYDFYADAYSDIFFDIIKSFPEKEKIVASICTGAFPVAKSGILNNKEGTTYNLNPVRQENLKNMGVNVVNKPIVEAENIITSWNPSTAMEVAFLLLEKLTDKDNVNLIKEKMGFDTT